MQLGDELVKEQLFFRRELRERIPWFIRLRWIAAGTLFAGTWLVYLQWRTLPVIAVNLIIFLIIAYNILFQRISRRLELDKHRQTKSYIRFAHTQIICDFLALYLLIYFTGSLSSPLLVFLFFHIVLAGILLSPLSCFLYCLVVSVALGALVALQMSTITSLQPPVFQNPLGFYHPEYFDILTSLAVFVAALFITAFLVTSLKLSLRAKGRELLRVSRELDDSNVRLSALYAMVTEMGGCTQLQSLMDSATRHAARIMGVKASSIKLLDDQREKLIFASTFGLSESYIKTREGIEVAKSPINRKIIEGSLSVIGEIHEQEYFQYPEDIRQEGIASMICLPLAAGKRVLGVFCVYSGHAHYFSNDDVTYFSLMADLTTLSIKNLQRDLDKTWFLQKAAHQLRSPLNTVQSMLNLVSSRHCGPVTAQQAQTLERSARRLQILGNVVADLLKLGIARSDLYKKILHPISPAEILDHLRVPYQSLAAEKNVNLVFDIEEPLPRILADEQLVDDLFSNLIANAVKYTPLHGTVRVGLALDNSRWVRFEVRDTGIGVPAKDIAHLFEEFFRSANARQLVEDGTGLGLAVVKEILDHLKGTISVKSTLGEGTCFTCRLPIFDRSSDYEDN